MATRPPSKRWYRLATSLFVIGLLAAGAWWFYATSRVYDEVEGFQRLAPFGGKVQIDETGAHTLWVEGSCLSCRPNDPSEYRAAATVEVTDPDGEPVTLRNAPDRLYNTSRREGRSLWTFDVDEPGVYTVAFELDTSQADWDNVVPDNLAIGEGRGLAVGIVRPMVVFALAGTAAAVVITAVTAVRRRRYYETPFHERT